MTVELLAPAGFAPAIWLPKPPQLDQKKSETPKPMIPTISRMTPTVWMLIPLTVALTAQIRTAPAAARRRLKLSPIFLPPLSADSEKRVQVDDLLPILENAKTTIATTISRNRNFETTSPPPIAMMRRTSRINNNMSYLPLDRALMALKSHGQIVLVSERRSRCGTVLRGLDRRANQIALAAVEHPGARNRHR